MIKTLLFYVLLVTFVIGKEQDNGSFFQLTDIHFDPEYIPGGDELHFRCTKKSENVTGCSPLGNYLCDIPMPLLSSALTAMKKILPDPDFLIWTGDCSAHYEDDPYWEEYTKEMIVNTNRIVNHEISNFFKTVYFTFGNHDGFPLEFFPPPKLGGSEWAQMIISTWDKFNLSETLLDEAKYGGYYSVSPIPGIRIVALNTQYCDFLNYWMDIYKGDSGGMFAWLNMTLDNARRSNEKVLMIGHISPGPDDEPSIASHTTTYCDDQIRIVSKEYSDIITSWFFGHEHLDSFRIFSVDEAPRSVGYLAPSLGAHGSKNPTFRLYHYSRETGEILDYDQYEADLAAALKSGDFEWKKMYSALEEYGMESLQAEEWEKLLINMDHDQDLFDKFRSHEFRKPTGPPECDDSCKNLQLCVLSSSSWKDFLSCVDSGK